MNKRYIGDVYYNISEMVHLQSFENIDGTICQQDDRTRFVYMIVSKSEALKVAGTLDDDSAVLDAVKEKYAPILLKAIEEEKEGVLKYLKLRQNEFVIDNKLIHLISIPAYNVTCIDDILYALKYFKARKNLEDKDKQKGEKKNVSYLKKSFKDCESLLNSELQELGKIDIKEQDKIPYVLISMPYVYNATFDENYRIKEYQCIDYQDLVTLSLMPKVRVEYGVFFDGTNNNMYNIDFYQNYKKYLDKQAKYVKDYFLPYDNDLNIKSLREYTFIEYIATHPNPQKETIIMNKLRNEIIKDIRYFEQSSTEFDKYADNENDKASKDSQKIFDFLLEVRDTFSKKKENILEKVTDWWDNISDVEGTPAEIKTFLIDEILPSGTNDSYINGYTNVKRLYEHYIGDDRLILDKDKKAYEGSLKRFKLYASGSGTIDPADKKMLDHDSFIGLGFGGGLTGVEAHIVYTCDKLVKQLREEKITAIDELVLDVFGFSRGATEVRHFICTIMKEFELLNKDGYETYALNSDIKGKNIFSPLFPGDDGVYIKIANRHYFNPLCTDVKDITIRVYAGGRSVEVPMKNPYYNKTNISIRSISFRHANIGDTVTHYGLIQSNDSKDLNIAFDKEKIGSVFHLMAMDEFRFNFEAHSIFEKSYEGIVCSDGNFRELLVPGAHADVGGGYENSPSAETIEFPMEVKHSKQKTSTRLVRYNDFIKWNNKYEWVDKKSVVSKLNFKKIYSTSNLKKIGFYYKEDSLASNSIELVTGNRKKTFYMHRENLSWKYELVTLKLFHDAAISDECGVPLVNILDKYKLKNQEEDASFLQKIYDSLKGEKTLDNEKYSVLRQKYIHHSSNVHSIPNYIANRPSSEGYNILYGQRVVYNSKGEKFPFKDFS